MIAVIKTLSVVDGFAGEQKKKTAYIRWNIIDNNLRR